ncbi:hormogonium polysaccharide biosynthesis protein HpsL [Roseofilum casamattae]|uniref:Hormogonium polysaccharide biosynthesis protein HpsL n=1 Tax=Roseofilum casamattae BLCC-M143 TaxID=3022442 RepID=A0ABT7BSW0_9CYAN|nr:hormogonium polysaccharide biosynthesis protein HpsL [Roseofilum casamattae]MDJ1182275.1 hormogonium polysaccharide biosynthesis protein HpsL [Roseofilum casamattae BLCC-M143]
MAKSKLKSKGKAPPPGILEKPPPTKEELAAKKREAANARKKFMGALGQSIGFGSVFGIIGIATTGDPKSFLGGLLGMTVLLMSLKYPIQALWAFYIYMPFSGTVVYWVGGANALFHLAKDAFYIPGLMGIYQYCKRYRLPFFVPKAFIAPLFLLLAYCIFIILFINPQINKGGDKPILLGILGLKVFMGYIPLVSCGYYMIRGKKELLWITRITTVLAIITCVLCLMQYQMLSSGTCQGTRGATGDALFKASVEAKCLVGGALTFSPSQNQIRLPSTLASPWHWGWYMICSAFFTFATAFCDSSPFWQIAGFVGMGLNFICSVISGQRIATLLVPVVTIILLVLTGQVANLKRFIPIALGLTLLLGGAAIAFPDVLQERIDSLTSRLDASNPADFIAAQAEESAGHSGLFGKGLGRATNSARAFGRVRLIETWFPKVLYEVGKPGLGLFLLLVTVLTWQTFKAYRSVKDKNLRGFGACFWVFIFIISYQTYWYPLDTDPVCVYFWLFAGITLKLPAIDKEETKKKKELEALLEEQIHSQGSKKSKSRSSKSKSKKTESRNTRRKSSKTKTTRSKR